MLKHRFIIISIALFCSSTAFSSNHVDTTMVLNGTSHSLLFSIPDDYSPEKSYSLIIGLHYCGGNAEEYRNALDPLTDSLNVIIACPGFFGEQVPTADSLVYHVLVDTARSIYNIDTTMVFLNGMSCNAEYALRSGLKNAYPFKGIFPWAPWMNSANPDIYNFSSDMPTVISIGTNDEKLSIVTNTFDSLKSKGANVNFILVPDVGHTLNFSDFDETMIKSMYYLNDTSTVSLGDVEDIEMISNETEEVEITVTNALGRDFYVMATSSKKYIIENPQVVYDEDAQKITLSLEPPVKANGTVKIVVELIENDGTAIAQTVVNVKVDKYVSSVRDNEQKACKIYPNPVKEVLNLSGLMPGENFKLVSLDGKIIYQKTVSQETETINTSEFSIGLYFLIIESQNNSTSHKILID
ncbi:MAG: T9SS type A sorting domain-containing protein [Bacteroidales bacterium]|nr:T9SS type A sorting domain-containing protein [Bacteroidales bacterium]MBN2819328.1 T9SS type A sorting domain-containing protein [Bacteroidales bacterium]